MLRVSGLDLVAAACHAGVVGAFPTANARSPQGLDSWLTTLDAAVSRADHAPYCPNLIIRQPDLADHLAVLVRHEVEMVITSVGSPAGVVEPLHDVGTLVLSDVATVAHAEKAVEAGADGLVLLTAGAGGQTGWLNPFAFVRAIRGFFDGVVVLAGGVSDGRALAAAEVLGCDLGYLGTPFIATHESLAAPAYREMVVASSMDDVLCTTAFTGIPASMLRPSIQAAGLDPARLGEDVSADDAERLYGGRAGAGPRRWQDVWSAGHSVSGVTEIRSVADLVARVTHEYRSARPDRSTP
ncbi:MAG: 2-nitropropane dioxygenase [Klenkia sp.]|nr:2-nitropropane dioxygenase [Klenkia sp.]